jgi:2-keto-4-pentenoate hydratase/2-oxohepta-3-ene-1,7-dioic acid hydratase in catechol pathway
MIMRIVRFEVLGNIKYGMIDGDILRAFQRSPFSDFKRPGSSFPLDGITYKMSEVKLLAPCTPSKYVGIGLNYARTAENMKMPIPEVPIIFLKPTTSVIGSGENIVLPPGTEKVIHEGELALVVGKQAKEVPEETAKEYLLGYTCTNDVSDLSAFEKDGGNPTRAKGRDTFGPLGPWIETELEPDDLEVEAYVNGELHQSGSTSEFIFGINKIISFVSGVMTLLPGDIIATGTPPGSVQIHPGDLVEIKVEKIGTLRNSVVGSN